MILFSLIVINMTLYFPVIPYLNLIQKLSNVRYSFQQHFLYRLGNLFALHKHRNERRVKTLAGNSVITFEIVLTQNKEKRKYNGINKKQQ